MPLFQSGGTLEQAATDIVVSQEWGAGLTQNQIVTNLFVEGLGRNPTSQELTNFANTSIQVLRQWFSAARRMKTISSRCSMDFLRRGADVSGINFFTNFFPTNGQHTSNGLQPDVNIIAALLGSQEYQQKVQANQTGLATLPSDPLKLGS